MFKNGNSDFLEAEFARNINNNLLNELVFINLRGQNILCYTSFLKKSIVFFMRKWGRHQDDPRKYGLPNLAFKTQTVIWD